MRTKLVVFILAAVMTTTFFTGCHEEANETMQTSVVPVVSESQEYEETTKETEMPENTTEIEDLKKLLTQVSGYHSNGDSEQYGFTYNERNLLVGYSMDSHSSSGSLWHHEYVMDYNENGQLIRYQEVGNMNPYRENYYSSEGILTGWSLWEYDSLQTDYMCEYDEQGRKIRESTGGTSMDYIYDEDGLLTSSSSNMAWGDMKCATVCTYSYDAEGRLIQTDSNSDWGGYIQTETIKYSYEYEPFVLKETCYDETNSYTDLLLLSGELGELAAIRVDGSAVFEMRDGYLIKISGDGYSYEFFYEGETDSTLAGN